MEQNPCAEQLTSDAASAQRFPFFYPRDPCGSNPFGMGQILPYEYRSGLDCEAALNEVNQVITSNWE